MKKLFTLFIASLWALTSFSQAQLTNGGFESWSNGIPVGWSTTKTIDPSTDLETQDTIDPYSGHSAIKIATGYAGTIITQDSLSGFVHYGPIHYDTSKDIATVDNFNAYFPCTPDSIRFAYKYTSVGGDHGSLNCYFANQIIDGYYLTASANWQLLTLPFYIMGPPGHYDSVSLTFFSSYDLNNHAYHSGSTLWLDSVSFIYNTGNATCATGVNSVEANQPIHVFPIPATDQVTLSVMTNETGSQVSIFDRIGREVYIGAIDKETYIVSTAQMESGYYVIRVAKDGVTMHTIPLTVLK